MTEHMTRWLAAYYDGELKGKRLRLVESHLAECAACQAKLSEMASLSALLDVPSTAETRTSPDRFVAQVQLRLPRRPAESTGRRVLERAWQLAPAGLLGVWAICQAVFIVAGVVLAALQLGLGGEAVAWLAPSPSGVVLELPITEIGLQEVGRIVLQLLSAGGPLGWGAVLNLVLMVGIGLLYWSWLATWWVRRRPENL
ncbi:MAG: zf-HC2 domain-containing protein [Anaerolineae bacterium]